MVHGWFMEFLDALASLDFKLSVSQSVIYRFSTASASTGLSELFLVILNIEKKWKHEILH